MKQMILIALLSLFAASASSTLEVTCEDSTVGQYLVVKHSASPFTANANDELAQHATFQVLDQQGGEIGFSEFTEVAQELDGFLNLLVVGFMRDADVVGVALLDKTLTSVYDIVPGEVYDGKSDLFVIYGDDKVFEGSTMYCWAKILLI
jgi:hypothetical protein